MPSATHVIGRQVLELRLGSERDAYRLQQEIAELFQRTVVPAVEAMLERCVPADRVLRLERVELDLGTIPPQTLSETFPHRVCEALERALAPYLQDTPPQQEAAAGHLHLSPDERLFALWYDVLAYGALPWWAERASAVTLEGDLLAALASLQRLPTRIETLLRDEPHALRRLALQGSTALRRRVLVLAAPRLAALALPLIVTLVRRPSDDAAIPESVNALLWEALLAEALRSPTAGAEAELGRALRLVCTRPAGAALHTALSGLLFGPSQAVWIRALPGAPAQVRERLAGVIRRVLADLAPPGGQGSASIAVDDTGSATAERRGGDFDTESVAPEPPSPMRTPTFDAATDSRLPRSDISATEPASHLPETPQSLGATLTGDRGTGAGRPGPGNGDRVRRMPGTDGNSEDHRPVGPLPGGEGEEVGPASPGVAGARAPAPRTGGRPVVATPTQPIATGAVTGNQARTAADEAIAAGRGRDTATPLDDARSRGAMRRQSIRHSQEAIFVDDAGLVLLHPFLATHFEKLGLQREGQFLDETARERAIHQLRFLATGHEDAPETLLVLPKLLCGLLPEQPIAPAAPPVALARSEADKLLAAVVRHWGALKNTSPDGLRETFLRRDGRLEFKDGDCRLRVASRSYDLLLGRLPWPLSVVRLPWMSGLLFVDWG